MLSATGLLGCTVDLLRGLSVCVNFSASKVFFEMCCRCRH